MEVAVIIPTLNAERDLSILLPALLPRTRGDRVWVIDSSSEDETAEVCRRWGVNLRVIDRATFNHGGTRNWARSLVAADVLVYMTQDALPAHPDALARLIKPLTDPSVAVAYGRQLARPSSGPLEAFPRMFNYPDRSVIKSEADLTRLGMKAFFCSNSFCAYRTDAWDAAGGFPNRALISEDHHLAARLLMAGYKVAYVAEAQVHHSHHYTLLDEFRRYFDHGAFLRMEAWMRELAGEAEAEGFRLVREQTAYLWRASQAHLIPYSFLAAAVKYVGYRVGYLAPTLPGVLVRRLSRQPYFWRESPGTAGAAETWRHHGWLRHRWARPRRRNMPNRVHRTPRPMAAASNSCVSFAEGATGDRPK